jgi:L-ascorbate metabolism protein UlaG (beta-lactamase superfamily)
MSAGVDAQRRKCAISVLGGPTTVVDIAGRRIVMDPTYDPPGVHGYLTKLAGPVVSADALGLVDAVLISHDQHPDNLDDDGRRFALAAPLVLTHPGAAGRLGPPALGLAPWETYQVPGSGSLAVQAVPAVHGPADGQRDASGHVNCEVTGFVLWARSADRVLQRRQRLDGCGQGRGRSRRGSRHRGALRRGGAGGDQGTRATVDTDRGPGRSRR